MRRRSTRRNRSAQRDSTTRTADQTQIAQFWNDGVGTYTPPGAWNEIAEAGRAAAGRQPRPETPSCSPSSTSPRPMPRSPPGTPSTPTTPGGRSPRSRTPTRSATRGITQDPNWQPLLITPPSRNTSRATRPSAPPRPQVLAELLRRRTTPSARRRPACRASRGASPASGSGAARPAMSRIYGGIHFAFSNTDALATGTAGRRLDARRPSTPATTRVHRRSCWIRPPALSTNQDPTITGDDRRQSLGVASLTVSLDGGAPALLPFNGDDTFSLPVALPTDGSADGMHTLTFVATDAAGNVDAVRWPSHSRSTPAAGRSRSPQAACRTAARSPAGARLTGTVTHPDRRALTALSYAFDGGIIVPVAFDPTTGRVRPGARSVQARRRHSRPDDQRRGCGRQHGDADAQRHSLPFLPPLTVVGVTPTDGATTSA